MPCPFSALSSSLGELASPAGRGCPSASVFWSLPTGSANHNHPHLGSQSEPFPWILTGADQAPSLPTPRLQGFHLELPPSRDSSLRVRLSEGRREDMEALAPITPKTISSSPSPCEPTTFPSFLKIELDFCFLRGKSLN